MPPSALSGIVVPGAKDAERAPVGLWAGIPLGPLGPDQLQEIRGRNTVLSGDDHISVRHGRGPHARMASNVSATVAKRATEAMKAHCPR